ncbi:MAG: DUF349 domain-containing protein [Dysgonamonadaceae bacterium]|jgi:hypothetical protein|nr:DUF349 domain-containing protein [Dysgonamonadaceae bacterium]
MNKLLNDGQLANENAIPEEKTIDAVPEKGTSNYITNELEMDVIASDTPKFEEIPESIPVEETLLLPIEEEEENSPDPVDEALLPEENEEKAPDPNENATKDLQQETVSEIAALDKSEIVEQMAVAVQDNLTETAKLKIEALREAFYKLKQIEIYEAKQIFINAGGSEETFVPEKDLLEEKLKNLLAIFREKKNSLIAETTKIKEENLAAKKTIIEKLKRLIESQDDFYKVYNEFRKLQHQWKEIKHVPHDAINDLWKDYQLYSEKFYDLLKINNEMRDYDFKKNLELKQALCESVERLDEEKDIVSAFYQLQKLHQEWREIGPVAKELREDIWSRFKKASFVINKKHQAHFESLRMLEQRNSKEKIALCEEIENIDYSKLTNFKAWDTQYKHVLEAQEKWKAIGFAPKKNNVKLFERFRAACDVFFAKKGEYYKHAKTSMDLNLEKKKSLCEKAEALKESEDWKNTTDKFIALQKEWKETGQVPYRYSDSLWKRFIGACDHFFEKKSKHFSSQKTSESESLKKKIAIIEQINSLDENLSGNDAIEQLRELMSEFNAAGHVPFREKDKIYKEYRNAVDRHFDRLKVDESKRRLQTFKTNVNEMTGGEGKAKNKLLNEREKLMRSYERLKGDIQTYENNIGFLSVSSKGGGGLLKEMTRKIETLKEELDLILDKIEVIDNSLEHEK